MKTLAAVQKENDKTFGSQNYFLLIQLLLVFLRARAGSAASSRLANLAWVCAERSHPVISLPLPAGVDCVFPPSPE